MENGEIYKKISEIMADVSAIGKDSKNKMQGFMYRGIDDVMNEMHGLLAKHGVFIVPEVVDSKREERKTKNGSTLLYSIQTIKFKFFAPDGSCVEAIVVGEGMDSGDKASNKALSIGLKYAILQVFCIPTKEDKDPDAESYDIAQKSTLKPPTHYHWEQTVKACKTLDELKTKYTEIQKGIGSDGHQRKVLIALKNEMKQRLAGNNTESVEQQEMPFIDDIPF